MADTGPKPALSICSTRNTQQQKTAASVAPLVVARKATVCRSTYPMQKKEAYERIEKHTGLRSGWASDCAIGQRTLSSSHQIK
jgi:hypothetical protein